MAKELMKGAPILIFIYLSLSTYLVVGQKLHATSIIEGIGSWIIWSIGLSLSGGGHYPLQSSPSHHAHPHVLPHCIHKPPLWSTFPPCCLAPISPASCSQDTLIPPEHMPKPSHSHLSHPS
ncbi:hypothetical protein SK128_024765 [Halocaridina rubra]|uniref:Uncharacterized protein n=1 Tax=Halocaridina rubra TaxID=373956 RepID=A0AAN8WWF1_HALRR